MVLFPHEMFAPRTVDAHFADELAACRAQGIATGLFDHDAPALVGPPAAGDALVRSWMFSVAGYAELVSSAAARDVRLRTSAAQYARAHTLPGWYEAFAALTPATVWAADVDALVAAARTLPAGPGVLKDHVKSLKHLWDTHCYVPDVHDAGAVRRVAEAFLKERGDALQGGLVLRAYEPFAGAEARTWWRDGRVVLITAHPDTPDEQPDGVPAAMAQAAVVAGGCPFVTVDFAKRTDGTWRVVEVGDGAVSDRPRSTPASLFVERVLA